MAELAPRDDLDFYLEAAVPTAAYGAVRSLIAEVRRLRAENADLRRRVGRWERMTRISVLPDPILPDPPGEVTP